MPARATVFASVSPNRIGPSELVPTVSLRARQIGALATLLIGTSGPPEPDPPDPPEPEPPNPPAAVLPETTAIRPTLPWSSSARIAMFRFAFWGSTNACGAPAAPGVGTFETSPGFPEPWISSWLSKFEGVMSPSDWTTLYRFAVPQSRSSPGALKANSCP